jgi:magnesium transporter
MGKKPGSSSRTIGWPRLRRPAGSPPPAPMPPIGGSSSPPNNNNSMIVGGVGGGVGKGKKKTGGPKLWMRFDRSGGSELVECDKSAIVRRAAIPARDLRILGPVFSHSSSILGKNFTNLIIYLFLIIYLSFYLFVYY